MTQPWQTPQPARAGLVWPVLALVLGILLVAGAVTGSMLYVAARQDAADERHRGDQIRSEADAERGRDQEVLTAARQRTERLLSYDYRTFDQTVRQIHEISTAKFRAEFDRSLANLRPQVQRSHAAVKATALDAGIKSRSADRAEVLVFVDQNTTSTSNPGGRVDRNRVLLVLRPAQGGWLIDEISGR